MLRARFAGNVTGRDPRCAPPDRHPSRASPPPLRRVGPTWPGRLAHDVIGGAKEQRRLVEVCEPYIATEYSLGLGEQLVNPLARTRAAGTERKRGSVEKTVKKHRTHIAPTVGAFARALARAVQ